MSNKTKKVIVGMSGGVDSSVAAAVLKSQGYEVEGLFMRNWDEKDENGICQASLDLKDAEKVCDKLSIKLHEVNFSKQYWENVFLDFVDNYQKGLTPNPDILCNREIKFKVFFEKAMELGGDLLATGHYCSKLETKDGHFLQMAVDQNKDQTYFLNAIKETALAKTLFPLGSITKPKVRSIAEEYNFITANKKDSTGICFIGERNFKNFLSQYIHSKEGYFKTLSGEVVGTHNGISFYTQGQRKGLGLGGAGEPWFVIAKDIESNTVFVERGEHPALYSNKLYAHDLSWINPICEDRYAIGSENEVSCKIRYRQKSQRCKIKILTNNEIEIEFEQPQRAISPGQSVAIYDDEICLGGAFITKAGPSLYDLGSKVLPEFVTI